MKLIIWGGLLAMILLADPATAQSCKPKPPAVDPSNVALGKPAYQSSLFPDQLAAAPEKAVNGDCNGVWDQASCTHTNLEKNPWWLVDLGESYKIHRVVVKNREDCCGERLFGAEIRVGNSLGNNGRSNHLCGTIQDASLGSISVIYCNEQQGRYISVHLPREDYLTICEVEVYRII